MKWTILGAALLLALASLAGAANAQTPTLWIIGDSTVKNGTKGQQGWGDPIASLFDATKIRVVNRAIGGRSSRTFLTDGRWDAILTEMKPGDYVLMQFGHNDSGPLDDTARARGTIRGTGDESKEIDNPITKKREVVHTYGWYLRKYVADTKAKGATPIVLSPIPRNDWKDGKVLRSSMSYGGWAAEVAKQEKAFFIDLNERVAARYETLGEEKVKAFFPDEHTHTNAAGATVNAECVVDGVKALAGCDLKKYLAADHAAL